MTPYEIEYTHEQNEKPIRKQYRDKRTMERELNHALLFQKAFDMSGTFTKYYVSPDGKTREVIE